MLKITLIRVFLVIIIGFILYVCLLGLFGVCGSKYLRKRKYQSKNENKKALVIQIYSFLLVFGTGLLFLIISFVH